MIQTLPLESLEQNADNVYEAIIMVSRRARQINELQKQVMDKATEAMNNSETFDDEGVNHEVVDHQYLKLPKPTSIALQEFLQSKLTCEYID
ncbi:MAG TPA: DNA-directed RNA polymerase subunit omega [bacterium]|nr:DNA-directed RNA polymerase subunit omega [bacterium]